MIMTGREAAFARILRRRQIKNDTALVTFDDEKGSNGEKTTIRLNFIVIRISLEMLNRLSFNVSICDIATIF